MVDKPNSSPEEEPRKRFRRLLSEDEKDELLDNLDEHIISPPDSTADWIKAELNASGPGPAPDSQAGDLSETRPHSRDTEPTMPFPAEDDTVPFTPPGSSLQQTRPGYSAQQPYGGPVEPLPQRVDETDLGATRVSPTAYQPSAAPGWTPPPAPPPAGQPPDKPECL